MADELAVQQALYEAERLLMFCVKVVGRREGPEILNNACLLDVGVATRPLHRWSLQAIGPCPVSAKTGCPGERGLQSRQERSVKNKPFEVHPTRLCLHLNPGMDDFLGCDGIDQLRNNTALQCLVNGESMQAAPHADRAQQRHEKRPLGVALTKTVSEHTGGRDVV